MSWVIWIIIAIFSASLEKCLNRLFLSKSSQEWEYMLGYNIGALLLLISVTLSEIGSIGLTSNLCLLILSGAIWFISCLYTFKADRFAEVSLTSIISQLQVALVCFGGIVFFGESLTYVQVLGVALVVMGLCFLFHKSGWKFNLGIFYKLISVTAMTCALLLDKYLVSIYDGSIVAISGFLVPSVIIMVLQPKKVVAGIKFVFEHRFYNIAIGILGGLGYLALLKAMALAPLAVVFPAFQINIILTVLLGIWLLKEKEHIIPKIISAIIVLLGTILLK
jgi:transporter family protein